MYAMRACVVCAAACVCGVCCGSGGLTEMYEGHGFGVPNAKSHHSRRGKVQMNVVRVLQEVRRLDQKRLSGKMDMSIRSGVPGMG